MKNKYVLIEIVYGKVKLKSVSHKQTEIIILLLSTVFKYIYI